MTFNAEKGRTISIKTLFQELQFWLMGIEPANVRINQESISYSFKNTSSSAFLFVYTMLGPVRGSWF